MGRSKALIEKALRLDGLSYHAIVTTWDNATQFKADDLAGWKDDYFNGWYVYVVRDLGGAGVAPQNEIQPISNYADADGTFTHLGFTVNLAVGDEILILHESIGSIIINTGVISNIFNLVNALLTLTETGSTITTDGTVQNLYINENPSGIYDPKNIQLDFTAQAAGETIVIRESYRIKSGGNYIEKDAVTFTGVQSPKLKNIILEENRFGIKVTIQKTAGANKDYDWRVMYKT